MNYMIGCNYWDSESGTDMWRKWNEKTVDSDLRELSKYGVEYLRVFPNWRDFQPVASLKRWQGTLNEYRIDDKIIEDEFGLDYCMMERFGKLCDIAKKYGMKLIVSVIMGWMSGRLFMPPALENKDLISDPEALMWEIRFTRGFVRYFKNREEIAFWDIGNECNNLASCNNRHSAWLWTASIRNAILCEDNTRKIMSGMHFLGVSETDNVWTLHDQGELTDVMCPHPYPSPSVGGDVDPMTQLRTTIIPTVQSVLYSNISKKPSIIQETGSFNDMVGCRESVAKWIRVNMLSCWANGSMGYLWWCAHDHRNLNNPPYSWSMIERELGILEVDRTPKPAALEMKKMSDMLRSLPFDILPKREIDAVCIVPDISNVKKLYHIMTSAYILAKQAGIEIEFCYYKHKLPKSKLYIVPSLFGWSPMNKEMIDSLETAAYNGASVYFSSGNGIITSFEKLTGLKSVGMLNDSSMHIASFDNFSVPFKYGTKFLTHCENAECISKDNDGTVIFSKNSYGKGKIYFLNFPLEEMIWDMQGVFNDEKKPYYKIYNVIKGNLFSDKAAISDNPQIGVTVHKLSDNKYVVTAINYSDECQDAMLNIKGKITCLYGNIKTIDSCDASVMLVDTDDV